MQEPGWTVETVWFPRALLMPLNLRYRAIFGYINRKLYQENICKNPNLSNMFFFN